MFFKGGREVCAVFPAPTRQPQVLILLLAYLGTASVSAAVALTLRPSGDAWSARSRLAELSGVSATHEGEHKVNGSGQGADCGGCGPGWKCLLRMHYVCARTCNVNAKKETRNARVWAR